MKISHRGLAIFLFVSSFTLLSCAEETTLSITPSKATLPPGGSRTFKAGGIAPSRKAVWSIQEGAAGGSITSNGAYTAPSIPGTYHVILSRPGLRPRKAAATITVTGEIAVSIAPEAVALTVGGSRTFTAAVTGSADTAVA